MVITAKPVMPNLTGGRINPELVLPEWRSLYTASKLRHVWVPLMNPSAGDGDGRLDDLWGGVHGTPTANVSWELKEGGRCANFAANGGSDKFSINPPDIIDLQAFTVMAYVQTNNTGTSADPRIIQVREQPNVKITLNLDWNDPNAAKEARWGVSTASSTVFVSLSDFFQQDRYYTIIGRYDGANIKIDGYDWNIDNFGSNSAALTGDAVSPVGGPSSIGNSNDTPTPAREWGGDMFLVSLWNSDIGDEMTQRLLLDPVTWLKKDPYYGIRRYFPKSAAVAITEGEIQAALQSFDQPLRIPTKVVSY